MCPKSGIYSEEFKWKVVQDVLSGNLTKEEAHRIYSVKGNCTILYWMRAFSGIKDYRNGVTTHENINIELLSNHTIEPSMTQNGDPLENPIAERVNLTIKQEFMDDYKQGNSNRAQALEEIPRNIEFYN
ncbi:hypothetical protein BH23BAC3_BH23BAC3_33500 [soil metagenome]